MEFNVVIGNPPYSIKSKSGKTNVTTSSKFFKKSLNLVKDGGSLGMVLSAVGMSAGQQSITPVAFVHEVTYLSPSSDGKAFFPDISMAISVIVLKKNNTPTQIPYNDGITIANIDSDMFTLKNRSGKYISYIPKHTTHKDLDILNKVTSYSNDTFQFRSSLVNGRTNIKTYIGFRARGRIPADPAQFRCSHNIADVNFVHPVGLDYHISTAIATSVFCSYLYMWMLYKVNGADTNACPASLSYLPKIPLDKVYTHNDLMTVFSINQDESQVILDWASSKPAKFWNTK